MADNVIHSSHGTAQKAEHAHPGPRTYVMIAVILAILTAAEVAVVYVPALEPVVLYLLVAMSAAKFILVVMFYMHLKFDSKLFSRVFYGLSLLATLLISGLLLFYSVLGDYRV